MWCQSICTLFNTFATNKFLIEGEFAMTWHWYIFQLTFLVSSNNNVTSWLYSCTLSQYQIRNDTMTIHHSTNITNLYLKMRYHEITIIWPST